MRTSWRHDLLTMIPTVPSRVPSLRRRLCQARRNAPRRQRAVADDAGASPSSSSSAGDAEPGITPKSALIGSLVGTSRGAGVSFSRRAQIAEATLNLERSGAGEVDLEEGLEGLWRLLYTS